MLFCLVSGSIKIHSAQMTLTIMYSSGVQAKAIHTRLASAYFYPATISYDVYPDCIIL